MVDDYVGNSLIGYSQRGIAVQKSSIDRVTRLDELRMVPVVTLAERSARADAEEVDWTI
jgi:hypothetical protein